MLRRAVIACAMLYSIVAGAACSREVDDAPQVESTVAALTASDCPAGYNVIQGTNAAETLTGTTGNDCIVGKAGNDTIFGRGGNDFLIGGDGNDALFGEAGDDTLYGEAGGDRLEGGDGNDVLWGGLNVDNVYGQGGDDQLNGEAAGDTLEGGPGKDLLRGGDGDDTLRGGEDDDRLLGESGVDNLYGDAGRDVLHGGTQADNIWGGDGDDVIQGFDGNDTLNGEAGDDAVIGGSGTNTINGGAGTDACTGAGCEKAALTPTGCAADAQCSGGKRCVLDVGLCLLCVSDQDGDGVCDSQDACVSDANKSAPGACGCGVADTDSDGDGTSNCTDGCPNDAGKTVAGVCGCGVADTDSDNDGSANCNDGCPNDVAKTAAGACGCGVADTDSDADGTPNCNDGCPSDALKVAAGACGCGVADTNSDGDAVPNCMDGCPTDPAKITAGVCGCGTADTDSDSDGTANCTDVCPGSDDSIDSDSDGTPDGCDEPTECQIWTTGAHVHNGDAHVSTPADLAALEGIVCITGSLYVSGPEITGLVGLDSLFGVAEGVWISGTQLTSLDGLDALRTLGSMGIYFNSALQDVLGLGSLTEVRGDLRVLGNPLLGSVDGLEALTDIRLSLQITDNASLSNLHGLSSLAHLGENSMDPPLVVARNAQLPGCWIWALQSSVGLTSCGTFNQPCDGNTGAGTCGTLPPDFACVPGARGPGVYDGYLNVDTADELASLFGLACVTEGLSLSYMPTSDLSALSNLRAIGGALNIYASPSLTSLHGLENLRSVGYGIWIVSNSQLTSISALSGVTSIGSRLFEIGSSNALNIYSNVSLPGCQTWQLAQQLGYTCGTEAARCTGNTGTSSCGTLPPDFACVPGAVGPGVYDGYIDISPWSPSGMQLNEFGGLTCVTADLRIYGSSATELSVLSSLEQVGGSLWLHDNQGLTSLAGLEHLKSVGRSLDISNHASLTSLAALSSLTTVAGSEPSGILTITNNTNLPQCSVWTLEDQVGKDCGWSSPDTGFYACRGNRGQGSCGTLPTDFACVPGATGPGVYDGWLSITPWDTNGLQLDELGGLTCVTEGVSIMNTNATDLSSLSSLQMVGNSLNISGNQSLVGLTGLEHLTSVGWHLNVWGNNALTNLAALSSLTSIGDEPNSPSGGNLSISSNASLPACWAWGVSAQADERCGQQDWSGAWLECRGNRGQGSCGTLPADFACVSGATGPGVYNGWLSITPWDTNGLQLDELGGLTCVTEGVSIMNTNATDLSSLSSLQMVGNSLNISGNQSLVSLTGLEHLTSVGWHLNVWGNNALTNLAALSSLTSIGDEPNSPSGGNLSISSNASLPACWAWGVSAQAEERCGQQDWSGGWLECRGNTGQGSCGTLPANFACVPGAAGPGVYDGSVYYWGPSSMSLSEFGGVTCVTGDVNISNSVLSDLTALAGLQMVGGSLNIYGNQSLVSLTGLEQLRSVGHRLGVSSNNALRDLDALGSLTSIGDAPGNPFNDIVSIWNNASLPACEPLEVASLSGKACGRPDWNTGSWTDCSGNLGTGDCELESLPPYFLCTPGVRGPGVYDGTLDFAAMFPNGGPSGAFGGVQCVTGDLIISQTALSDLTTLSHLQMVGGRVAITDNANLTSIAGLEQLTSIRGTLDVANNPVLVDLAPLSQLTHLAQDGTTSPESGVLHVTNNTSLAGCWAWMIADQTGQRCGHPTGENQWSECRGNTGEGECGDLPDDFVCQFGVAHGPGVFPGTLFIASSPENGWTLQELGGVTCVLGSVGVGGTELQDLRGAWKLRGIAVALGIHDNPNLVSLAGLEDLEYVGAALGIQNNPVLSDLSGLSNLVSLAVREDWFYGMAKLSINNNASLPACWETAMEEQTGLECGQTDWDEVWTDCSGNSGAGTCE